MPSRLTSGKFSGGLSMRKLSGFLSGLLFWVLFLPLFVTTQASAVELLTNGGFETGTLAGWTASTTLASLCCDNRFANGSGVSNVGTGSSNAPLPVISGNYSLYGDFDGSGPGKIGLTNSFTNSTNYSSAILSFDFQTGGGQFGSSEVRNLTAGFNVGNSTYIAYTYDLPSYSSYPDNPLVHVSVDVTSLLDSLPFGAVLFDLERVVPGNFTGPATFVADNFSLQVSSAVPEPSTWAMMILGFAGVGFMAYRRRNKSPALSLA
jgi:hypothetical protein